MKYRITHTTEYQYQDLVPLCHNEAYLTPRSSQQQTCSSHTIQITPKPLISQSRQDFFGNQVHYFAVEKPHKSLKVTAVSEVEVNPPKALDPAQSLPWDLVAARLFGETSNEILEARAYCLSSPFIEPLPELNEYALKSFTPERPVLEATMELMQRVFDDFTYDPNSTTIVTPLSEVFKNKRGVCQDFAHLMLACLRGLGLPARYVSGYLETLPPPGQVKLQGADASHAWLAVYAPGIGWIDFDPTNNKIPEEQHITTAWGRDYGDVTPLKGIIFGGGTHNLHVSVDVERVV